MNKINSLLLLLLLAGASTVMAREPYKCQKIRFSNYTPKHKSEAAPGADFSFTASAVALPNSIRVKIKKIEVPIKVEKKGKFYKVTGQLPPALENTFARITITGNAVMECETKGGWLLNITGSDKGQPVVDNVKEMTDTAETAVEQTIE